MATNTTNTFTNHTGNGTEVNFSISFSYILTSDIDVTVAGVLKTLGTHYTISGSTVTFTVGNVPANGAAIKFQRDTSISTKAVDFQDGSVLTEQDLDNNTNQVLFAQQEITDKLGGIEEGATADQTNAEIKTAYEANSDTNAFTDALQTKLNNIESNATADQTNAEIRAAVEAASDSNVFTDNDHTKLNNIEANATQDQTVSEIKSLIAGSPLDASHLAANSVDSSELVDGSVDTSHLSADSVTNAKIADDSIDSEHYVDGSIDNQHIANSTITSAKIADATLDTATLANSAVTEPKIATGAVTTAKIADDAVTNAKIANNSIANAQLQDGVINTAKLATNSVSNVKIQDGVITTDKMANDAVTTGKIADAELKTLAGMQSATASKLADSTALTSDIADLNQIDGLTKQTTISDSDASFPTSGAVVDYVAAQIAPIGGLEVIATDAAFPNTQPQAGVVISIADAGGLVVNSSGTSTTARTVGGSTVTINNFASNFNSSTVDAGVAIMVSSTGSGQVYNYHKATLKEADLLNLSNDINDFGNRYRVTNGEPTSNNDEGDLIYDTQADKMKVFDSTTNSFKEVTSVGDFKFLFLCPTGGSGSPTINGSIATYDLREGSTSGAAASVTSAAQLLVSVNGVIQKANTGTSAPSEGFAMVDSNTIVFGGNLPTGAEVFVIQIGSAISLQVPADNTVATAKLQNGAVATAKIVDDAVTTAKIANSAVTDAKINGMSASKLTGALPAIDGSNLTGINTDLVSDTTPQLGGNLDTNSFEISFDDNHSAIFGDGSDLKILHTGSESRIDFTNTAHNLKLMGSGGSSTIELNPRHDHNSVKAIANAAVEIYHNNNKKIETHTTGGIIHGDTNQSQLIFKTSDAVTRGSVYAYSDNSIAFLNQAGSYSFRVASDKSATFYNTVNPNANNSYDLGTSSYRWRNIYTNDLNLSNEGSSNDVDGTWGSYTIQEGAEDLFLINKRNGKKYKFNLTEVN